MGRVQGVRTPPEMTCGFLIQLVFCQTMWFIGVEVEQEKSAPPPKKILDPPLFRYGMYVVTFIKGGGRGCHRIR